MKYITYKENRVHGTSSFPVASYYIYKNHPRYKMILHWHDEMEIIIIRKGELNINIDTINYRATEGDILFLSQGVLHSAIPKNCIYECFVFDLNYLYKNNTKCAELLRGFINEEKKVNFFLPSVNNELSKCIEDIFITMNSKEFAYELMVSGYLYKLFYLILKHHLYENRQEFSSISKQKLVQFKKVIHYIEINFNKKITLDDLSRIACYDKKYFCELFKKLSGKTPIQYLNSYRIEFAGELLLTTQLSITEIAYQSGMEDVSYFSKQFKRYKELSPRQYRIRKNN
ncbi:MAG: AraC family transcriptional regulator [Sphaerochaeta sp.]